MALDLDRNIMEEIKPTKHFYQTFRVYKPDRKCKCCGQKIKSKRSNVKFYLVGITKDGFLKIKQSNLKSIRLYHKDYFIKLSPLN